jgi:glycosyltransferase involved in cell wall biosynthesis
LEKKLFISAAIITFNRAEWLKDALASLTRQTRPPDEVVVVDNGSKDHTKDVVLNFSDRLNIKYVYEPVRGIPHARNTAIKNATGDIIVSIDDDCVADENWLKQIEKPFIKDPHIGIVGGNVTYFRVGEGSVEEFYIKNMSSSLGTGKRE